MGNRWEIAPPQLYLRRANTLMALPAPTPTRKSRRSTCPPVLFPLTQSIALNNCEESHLKDVWRTNWTAEDRPRMSGNRRSELLPWARVPPESLSKLSDSVGLGARTWPGFSLRIRHKKLRSLRFAGLPSISAALPPTTL